jgi:hypothetical protein
MSLQSFSMLHGQRSPYLTDRTVLVWEIVDAARLLDTGYENIKNPAPERKQLHEAVHRLDVYESKLKRILETTDQRFVK